MGKLQICLRVCDDVAEMQFSIFNLAIGNPSFQAVSCIQIRPVSFGASAFSIAGVPQ